MRRKTVKIVIFIVVCVLIATAVGVEKIHVEKKMQDAVVRKEDNIRVAFSMAEGNTPWTTVLIDELKQAAKAKNMELIYHEPEEATAEWQSQDLKELLSLDIDYLVIFPREDIVLEELLQEEVAQMLPIILISKDGRANKEFDTVIYTNYELEGRMCARVLGEIFRGEECRIVEVFGPKDSSVALERSKGFRSELLNYPNLSIVNTCNGNFDRLTAQFAMEKIISSKGLDEFEAVFASSDEDGLGALQALRITGYQPGKDIKLVSVNGTQDVLKAIVAGEYTATIESGRRLGHAVFETIARRVRGFEKANYMVVPCTVYDGSNAEKYLSSLY